MNNIRIDFAKISGFALIEVIVASGLLAIGALAASTLMRNQSTDQARIRSVSVRDTLKTQMERMVWDSHVLNLSATNDSSNAALKYCMTGPTPGCSGYPNCCAASTTNRTAFKLLDPAQAASSPATAIVSGTANSPAYYDKYGAPCTGGENACAFKVSTSFRAECAAAAATCARADRIYVSYSIQKTSQGRSPASGISFINDTNRTDLLAVSMGAGAAAGPRYSADCMDWSTQGWPSMSECLADGRWHHVMSNSAAGAIYFGSKAALVNHIASGANIKVASALSGNTVCTTAYQSSVSGAIYCLVGMRFAGEAPPYITASTSRIGSDGSLYCLSENQTNMNACAINSAMDWYVQY